ncbi:MAG: hypothetical protein AAGD38_13760 [Acidobacteriota bacterium]
MTIPPVALARFEHGLRPLMTRLPFALAVEVYSRGRERFLRQLVAARPAPRHVPSSLTQTLWGIEFRAPLFNAAGMFKNGRGYELCAAHGAGAYLAGTTTSRRRRGNDRQSPPRPFFPYPRSHAAVNWLGLPNDGHAAVASRLANVDRVPGCPIGVSVGTDTDGSVQERLEGLLDGLRHYDDAGVDFIEINESCPNTEEGATPFAALAERLETLSRSFLRHRNRRLPVLVKFSCDTDPERVAELIDLLLTLRFDGVIFGNTSTAYDRHRATIDPSERGAYDTFARRFGGGVSGRVLAADARTLCGTASRIVSEKQPTDEFHVVRVGGVETATDVDEALADGAALCQWYTGLFSAYATHGDDLYAKLYGSMPARNE